MTQQRKGPVGPGDGPVLPIGEPQLGIGEGPIQPRILVRRCAVAQILVQGGPQPIHGGGIGTFEGIDDGVGCGQFSHDAV